ncbi:MAG: toxin-activating lysine-acyltransferase [Pseudomonadota bacterium]
MAATSDTRTKDTQANGTSPSTPDITKQDTTRQDATKPGTTKPDITPTQAQLDPDVLAKISAVRARVNETVGKVALALMSTPRYRHLAIADLNHLILDPLLRDRIAMAAPAKNDTPDESALAGIAIWASVSEEVDAKIREQIKAGTFPVRLKPEDWTSGDINWLFDVIAPTKRMTTSVIANLRQVIKQGDLRIHPIVTRLADADALKQMGAAPVGPAAGDATS